QISNNLSQAGFVVSGAINQSGQGLSTTITNAPLGEYVVRFFDVPYYQTPPSQTNSLTSSNVLAFYGNYTFADSNTNGISDAWEQQFFGDVSSRPPSRDSDGDGFSDYAEFMAGTN